MWDTYGIPELLTVDNAKEFYCKSFKDACFQLGIDLHYAPRRSPWFKGSMERFYSTINTELLHEMPGTTFSNIFKKRDYDPKKHAVVSLDALIEMTHIYIIDDYHQSVHRGIIDIPAERWKRSIKEWPPNIPARKEDLEVLLGHMEERSIDSAGIEFHYLHYNSPELGMIRRQLNTGEKAVIKLDVSDISFMYVYDKMNDSYLPVPALDQEYTKGLTLWQHIVISNYRRKFAYLLEDPHGLARTKLLLQEIVEREIQANKILSGSEKIARYLSYGMPNYAELLLKDAEDTEAENSTGQESEEDEQGASISISSQLAGISDPTKGSAADKDAGGDDDNDGLIESVRLHGPDNRSPDGADGDYKKGKGKNKAKKAGKEDMGAKKSKKKSTETDAGAKPKSISVELDDDGDPDEGEWGSDYDLPV
jgi:putative transposase